MIRLHQFAPALGLPNASPFCMKVETWLRLAGVPFETVNDGNVLKAPKGKLPWVEDGALRLGDSSFIIRHLQQQHGQALDAWLTPLQRAEALAWQRLLEEHLYWAMVHLRWMQPQGWAMTRTAFFGHLPPPLRWIVPPLARRGIATQLRGHGLGRHGDDEIVELGRQDVQAVATFLADKAYMMGEAPCTLDACAYAFLANLLWAPLDTPLRRAAQAHANLDAYCRRMRQLAFG